MPNNKITAVARPQALLLLYDNLHIDYREILVDGSVTASRPLYQETIDKIFRGFKGGQVVKTFKSFIPKNMLYSDADQDIYVWYRKAEVREIKHTKKENCGSYALPTLVFKLVGSTLHVVAVKGIRPNAVLYEAPLSNIGSSGTVCMGSASLDIRPLKYIEDAIELAENNFYYSKFTHEFRKYEKIGKGKKVFPNKKLIPTSSPMNLEDFIEH
jgi:PRTRC genetic system protein B